MFTVTRYCIRAWARRGGQLVAIEAREFRDADEALRQAAAVRRRAAGAAVYSVTGEPGSNLWRDPILLQAHGDTPAERAEGI